MENPYRILLAEGGCDSAHSVGRIIEAQGWKCVRVAGCAQAIRHLGEGEFDVLVAGYGMAGDETRELARAARDTAPEVPVLVAHAPQREGGNGRGTALPDSEGLVRRVGHAAKLGRLAGRQGDDYFRSLVQDVCDVLQVGLLALDANSRISWVNLALETYLGISREEALGRDYHGFLLEQVQHVMAEPQAFACAAAAAQAGGGGRFECHVLPGNGREERWLEYQSHPVCGGLFAGGRVEHFADITVRRRAEQSLRRREHILSAVTFASKCFLQSGPWEKHIEAVLCRLGESTGVSAVYVLENHETQDGAPFARLCHAWWETGGFTLLEHEGSGIVPLDKEGVSHLTARLRRGEVVLLNMDELTEAERNSGLFKGGGSVASVPILVSGAWWGTISFDVWEVRRDWSAAEIDALKAAASILGAAIQYRRSEREVQAAHDRLELALNGADLALWDLNIQTNEVTLSAGAAEMLGYSPDTLGMSSRAWFRLVHPADWEDIREATRAHVTGRAPLIQTDFRVRASNGEWRWVHSRGRVVEHDSQGRPLRAAGTHLDVTARKRAEEEARVQRKQLAQAEKLASLGILVSGVAHEINNPNQLVLGNLSLLKDAYDGIVPILDKYHEETGPFLLGGLPYSRMRGELAQMFSETRSGALRIQRIVKELRDFARQGPTRIVEPVCLDDVVLSAVTLTRNSVESSTRRFSLSLHGSLPLIEGNAQHLEQVAINLILNACQALPGADRGLAVSTGFDEASQVVMIRVSDEGIGMTQDVMQHLTDPFFTTKRDTGGTGLGLAISARIVSEHGGSMTFDSTPGKGTTASVLFPVRKASGAVPGGD